MSVRNTLVVTTSVNDLPAASSTAAMLRRIRSVCAVVSPAINCRDVGSSATWPLKNTKLSARTAAEYGPSGGAILSVVIVSLVMFSVSLSRSECLGRGRADVR